MNKKCSICQQEKSLENFNKNKTRKDGFQTVCRSCNRKRAKKYYKENLTQHRATVLARKKKIVKQNQQKMWNFLLESQCVDCGDNNPLVLEFDHIKPKTNNVSQLLLEGYSWEKISEEIKKCVVRCANCHNEKTHKEKNTYRWKFFQK